MLLSLQYPLLLPCLGVAGHEESYPAVLYERHRARFVRVRECGGPYRVGRNEANADALDRERIARAYPTPRDTLGCCLLERRAVWRTGGDIRGVPILTRLQRGEHGRGSTDVVAVRV